MIFSDQTFTRSESHWIFHVTADLISGNGNMPGTGVEGDKAETEIFQFFQHLLGTSAGFFHPISFELAQLLLELADQIIAGQHIHFLGMDLLGQFRPLLLDALLKCQLVLFGEHFQFAALGLALMALLLQALG